MARVRTTHFSSLLSLLGVARLTVAGLAVAGLAVAGCGDGIDERTEPLAPEQAATTSTTEPASVDLPTFEFDELDVAIDSTKADYSGARSALHLSDGTWLVSGYDNHSTFVQPEPGAVWRGDELTDFERIGDDISDEDGQQVISSLLELASGRIMAVGINFSRDDPTSEFFLYDADVWLSDDQGGTFRKVSLRLDAAVAGALVIEGTIYAYGYQFGEGDEAEAAGQIWRSDDEGETWNDLDPMVRPTPGAAPIPLGTIERLLHWDGSLIAVGLTSTTDPDGDDYPFDRLTFSSPTQQWEPIDVGLWYSDDLGSTWHASAPEGLSAQPNAQVVSDATIVGDQLVIVGSASEVSLTPFDFDPGDFDPGDFNTEEFDVEDFDLDDFEFEDLSMLPTIWTCDYLLQRCDALSLETEASGFVSGMVVERDGFALVAFSAFSDTSAAGEQLVAFHPLTGEFEAVELPRSFAQTSAIVLDGDRLVLFGRHARLDELDVLVTAVGD